MFSSTVCPFLYQTRESGSCYYFSNGMTSYESARGFCLNYPEGDLVIIDDQGELEYLLEMTSEDENEESRWIGTALTSLSVQAMILYYNVSFVAVIVTHHVVFFCLSVCIHCTANLAKSFMVIYVRNNRAQHKK